MIDFIKLHIQAGDGGNGRVSFLRMKYMAKGGPDGGKGGDGGSVIVRASKHLATLKQFSGAKSYVAEAGQPGGRRQMSGQKGEDLILEVPLGTEIRVVAENSTARKRRKKLGIDRLLNKEHVEMETFVLPQEGAGLPPRDPDELFPTEEEAADGVLITQLLEDGDEIILAQGGFGGKGNEAYKSSTRTTPLIAEYGTFGEKKDIIFELKLLADIGLVGYPNAGKSTIVSSLTGARTKIGAYPFTTLEPHLGMLKSGKDNKIGYELIVADIPGLIEGASEGKGLGHDFLKHVEHSRVLWYVLSLDDSILFDETITVEEKALSLWQQYQSLRKELKNHTENLLKKKSIVSINKIDIYTKELIDALRDLFKQNDTEAHFFSAVTGDGVQVVKEAVVELAINS